MDLFLATCQALGIGLAVGVGGPLAAMFVATMAHVEVGMNPEGTDWDFFSSSGGVLAVFVVNVAAFYGQRAGLATRLPYAVFAAAFGAVTGAASLAEEGEAAAIGLLAGAAAGLFAGLVAGSVLEGAKRRVDSADEGATEAAGTLSLIFAAAGIATAALALFVPPASLLALIGLLALASSRRRKAGEKYEGLRVLR